MRRWFLIALAILSAAHLYIWWQIVLPLPAPYWQLGTAVIALLGPSFPLTQGIARRRPRASAKPWLLVGYIWFGFAIYLFLGAIGAHLAVALCDVPPVKAAIWGGGIAVMVVMLGFLHVARGPLVRRVRVPMGKLKRPYTIVQLTDVHIGQIIGRGFAEVMVRRVNALKPDAIVITGDLVDGRLSELRPHIEPLRHLRARDGVFAVTGNHEYYWDPEPWLAHLRSLGIRILRNENIVAGGEVTIAGADDSSAAEDVPRAVAGADPSLPLVLLAHHPRTITRAVAAGVDLQLSGHTHGGQLLPWGYLARLFDPKVAGLKAFGSTRLYVSQGTGFWGPPLRVGTTCEISAITLEPA